MKKIFLFLCLFLVLGCTTTNISTINSNNFVISDSTNLSVRAEIKTGQIKMGHSSWIDTESYASGVLPRYSCGQKGEHRDQGYWMYDLKDQLFFKGKLNEILSNNEVYDENSSNVLLVDFLTIEQGSGSKAIYTFDVKVSLITNGEVRNSKAFTVLGNDESKEFWSLDGFNGSKSRATEKVLNEIINNLNLWLTDEKFNQILT